MGLTANSTTDFGCGNDTSMAEASRWIALVDDDPSVLKALTRLLGSHALHTKAYGSAQKFLEALPQGSPQCLIVDLQMPEMSGLDLHEHLMRRRIQIPTIIITAHDDAGVRERCKFAGITAFLLKPLQDTALFAAIEKAFRNRAQ